MVYQEHRHCYGRLVGRGAFSKDRGGTISYWTKTNCFKSLYLTEVDLYSVRCFCHFMTRTTTDQEQAAAAMKEFRSESSCQLAGSRHRHAASCISY